MRRRVVPTNVHAQAPITLPVPVTALNSDDIFHRYNFEETRQAIPNTLSLSKETLLCPNLDRASCAAYHAENPGSPRLRQKDNKVVRHCHGSPPAPEPSLCR